MILIPRYIPGLQSLLARTQHKQTTGAATMIHGGAPSFVVYDTISASSGSTPGHLFANAAVAAGDLSLLGIVADAGSSSSPPAVLDSAKPAVAKRKRRRRPRSCKNKEEAETQRMTHIAVERNRRRLMNKHLAVLRSLMPDSYVHKGDQASIVGGAIDFVKELEQLVQSLEAQKRLLQQKNIKNTRSEDNMRNSDDNHEGPPFAQFFSYPQYIRFQDPPEYPATPAAPESHQNAVADIEVTLVECHASVRILSPRRPRQLLKMVAGLESLRLTILHLNVTTLDSIVLYSLSAKVEEGCRVGIVDEIATAVHHLLSLIEAETQLLLTQ